MAVAPKYQVFISSTYDDLRTERDQVIRAVLEMGHIPVGMEMFSAADEEQWQIIARYIDESDYYAVVVAHRLGSTTEDGISYTRKEYEYARKKGIPCLGFVIEEGASWPADRIDTDPEHKTALDGFKALVLEKPVSFWSSAEDLHGKFAIALMKAFTAHPREGWVRASRSSVPPPELTAELTRLSAENAALRSQLSGAEADAETKREDDVRKVLQILFRTKRNPSYRYTPTGPWQKDASVELFRIFRVLGPEMMVERSVHELAETLAMEIRADTEQRWDIVAINQMKGLLADLMTLDLVEPSTRRHPLSDQNEYWTLSPLGVEVLKAVRQVLLRPRGAEDLEFSEEDASDEAPRAAEGNPSSPTADTSEDDESQPSLGEDLL